MLKAARVLFIIGAIFILIGAVSTYFTLTSGEKMLSANPLADNEQFKALADKAQAQIADLKANLPIKICELAAGFAAAIVGFVATKQRRRGTAFYILEASCLILVAVVFVSKNWFVGGALILALALSFAKITSLTKGGAVIPEE
jgi:hypothetical protein